MAILEMNPEIKILIVDEKTTNIDAMKVFLKKIGYKNMFGEENGYNAIQRIKRDPVDLILCRYNLTYVNGLAFFEELKADLSIQRIPFALFEEQLQPEDVALLLEYGVDGYLTLPFVGKDLAQLLANIWARYIDGTRPDYSFEVARRAYVLGDVANAEKIFSTLLSQHHLEKRCLVALGRIAKRNNNIKLAHQYARKAIEIDKDYVHAYQFLGEVFLAQNEPVEALDAFFKAISLSPKNPYRYDMVSEILFNLKLWSEAEKVFRQALHYKLESVSILSGLATSLTHQQQYQEAIKIYKKLFTEAPNNASFANNLAACYKNSGDFKHASFYYDKSIAIDPSNAKVIFNFANLKISMDKKEEAIALLNQALSIDPGYEKASAKLQELRTGQKPLTAVAEEKKETPVLEKEIRQKINSLLNILAHGFDETENGLYATSKHELDKAEKVLISNMPEEKVFQNFEAITLGLRNVLVNILHAWAISLTEVSTEITTLISDLVFEVVSFTTDEQSKIQKLFQENSPRNIKESSLREALDQRDSVFQNAVCMVIGDLQFQDLMAQILNAIYLTEKKALEYLTTKADFDLNILQSKIPSDDLRKNLKVALLEAKNVVENSKYVCISGVESFISATLIDLSNKLTESCKRLVMAVSNMQQSSQQPTELWKDMQKIVTISMTNNAINGINELEEILVGEEKVNLNVSALFGVVRYFILLKGRLETLQDIFSLLTNCNPGRLKDAEIRLLMQAHGADFRYIWKQCEQLCNNVAEKLLLEKALGKKL